MPDALVHGDTLRCAEMRHEVPLGIPDPFLFAEFDGRRTVVLPAMEAVRVRELGTDLDVRTYVEFGADEIRKTSADTYDFARRLSAKIVEGLGIRSAVVPRSFPTGIADVVRQSGVELTVDQRYFDDRRRRKNEHELAGIRRAQRAAEAGVAVARDLLSRAERRNGSLVFEGDEVTCELLKQHIQAEFVRHGALGQEMIVSHGSQTAVGHDMGSGAVGSDDVVLLDLFPMDLESACFADMTRTFVVGAGPEEIREWHGLCREALELGIEAVRPGVEGREVHRIVDEFFSRHGFPTVLTKPDGHELLEGFYHGLGHGVGLEVHEQPGLGLLPGSVLVAGDVVTIEPGLYRPGLGGVRLEDMVLVTEDGCERLTDSPYDLELA